jgi:DNA-binding transcriptional LysR family regulator
MHTIISLPTTSRFRYFDWDKAKTFYYVAHLGSFTEASKFTHKSQPALSRQIASLERALGCPLFCRNPRGVSLTRKGEELQKIIETTFQQLKDFTQGTQKIEYGEPRTLRIGLPKSLMSPVLNILKDYQRSRTYLTLEVIEDIDHKELPLLDLDMALRPFQKKMSDVNQQYLAKIDQSLFSSSVIISQKTEPSVSLYFIVPATLQEDYELKDIYRALRSGLGDGKKAETEQREAA